MGILTYRHACYWLLVVGHATCFNFSSTRSRLEYDEFGAVDIQSDSEPQVDGGLSPIRKMAAIGDSYSAGIGAGDRLGDVSQALDKNSGECCSVEAQVNGRWQAKLIMIKIGLVVATTMHILMSSIVTPDLATIQAERLNLSLALEQLRKT
jgi:hypothetical protein